MDFFNSAVDVLQTLVIALGAGLAIWGAINLLEGYGNDNPGAKSQGMKQLMAGGGVALIGTTLVPLLSGLFGCSEIRRRKNDAGFCLHPLHRETLRLTRPKGSRRNVMRFAAFWLRFYLYDISITG